jgi:hypothetical protein
MKKYYEGPEIQVRNYVLNPNEIVTTSNGDLEDGDNYTIGTKSYFDE